MEFDRETRLRSAVKGLSWRVIATLTIILIAYLKTGNVNLAIEIGAIEFVIKYLLYYFHERAWQMVPRGYFRRKFNIKS